MALSDDVQNRISAERLKQLTNDGDPNATTLDTTILGYAATDIEGDFELLASEDYDSANKAHLAIAVPAVLGKLYEYQGKISPNTNESYSVFIAKCERLREGNIPGPDTNSVYEIEQETSTDKFDFTSSHFNGYKPRRSLNSRGGDNDTDNN